MFTKLKFGERVFSFLLFWGKIGFSYKGKRVHSCIPGARKTAIRLQTPVTLVTVSTASAGHAPETVTPDKLSGDVQNFPGNILNVENFHNVFREFPLGRKYLF